MALLESRDQKEHPWNGVLWHSYLHLFCHEICQVLVCLNIVHHYDRSLLFLIPLFGAHFLEPILTESRDNLGPTPVDVFCVLEYSVSHGLKMKLFKVESHYHIRNAEVVIIKVKFIVRSNHFASFETQHILLENKEQRLICCYAQTNTCPEGVPSSEPVDYGQEKIQS